MSAKEDTYLLYEYMSKLPYTVKLWVELDEKIDPQILDKAAQEAITRLPYYHVRTVIENSGYAFVPNENPIPVIPDENKRLMLGSEAVGGNLFAITYKDSSIAFCFSHSVCGGFGAMYWIKTTLYQYLTALYGEIEPPKDLKRVGEKPSAGELVIPDPDTLPTDEPLKRYAGGDTDIGSEPYYRYFMDPNANDIYAYEIELPSKEFIGYCKSIDASPNTAVTAIVYKALARLYKDKATAENFIACRVADDYRKDISAEESYRDFVRMIFVKYDWKEQDSPIERLNMIARGAVISQMQPELSYERYRKLREVQKGIDAQPTLGEKIQYAQANGIYRSDPSGSCTISYVGQTDLGGLADHIKSMYTYSDGHCVVEVNALPDKICICYQVFTADDPSVQLFCDVLKEEKLPFKCSEPINRYLPDIELPKQG